MGAQNVKGCLTVEQEETESEDGDAFLTDSGADFQRFLGNMWGEREAYFRQAVFSQFADNKDQEELEQLLNTSGRTKKNYISLA